MATTSRAVTWRDEKPSRIGGMPGPIARGAVEAKTTTRSRPNDSEHL